jgi:hypothetical protein
MLTKVTRYLFIAILAELILGGGRLISLGPVSLRMVLFSLAIICTVIHLWNGGRIEKKYTKLLLVFTFMLVIGIAIGLLADANKSLLWEDVKPLLYFYLLPFFSFAITSQNDLIHIRKVVIMLASFMAFSFLTILLMISSGLLPFLDFYNIAYPTGEFFFRGEYSFFYKGFIYLCIGFLFGHISFKKNYWWLLIILGSAIALTFTRGFILALGLCYVVYYLFIKKYYVPTLAALSISFCILFFGKELYGSISQLLNDATATHNVSGKEQHTKSLLGDREFSDNERIRQIKQVAVAITMPSSIWGHGFGNGIDSRPVHMEISYLEIFHKQGLIGIVCWGVILLSIIISYKNHWPMKSDLGDAFLMSALFVFFQSLTNQYINNPIGLGMVLIALVSLNILSKKK